MSVVTEKPIRKFLHEESSLRRIRARQKISLRPSGVIQMVGRLPLLLLVLVLLGGTDVSAHELVRVGKAQGTAWPFLPVDVGMAQGLFAGQGLDIEVADLGGD